MLFWYWDISKSIYTGLQEKAYYTITVLGFNNTFLCMSIIFLFHRCLTEASLRKISHSVGLLCLQPTCAKDLIAAPGRVSKGINIGQATKKAHK